MRPGKFRFVALIQVNGAFSRANVSVGPPRHAAQDAFSVIVTPASTNTSQTDFVSQRVSFSACTTSEVPGSPYVSILTLRPLTTLANAKKSLALPPVHEPIYARSS